MTLGCFDVKLVHNALLLMTVISHYSDSCFKQLIGYRGQNGNTSYL